MVLQSTILQYQPDTGIHNREMLAENALRQGHQTAFLSHSHKDRELVYRLQAFLRSNGWNVYVDWQDETMPKKTSHVTANRIKDKIQKLDWFLYLATQNSAQSRWCPWEIGYADGVKPIHRIIVIPTTDSFGTTYGSEYLDLYHRIAQGTALGKSGLAVFDPRAENGTFLDGLRR